MGQYRPSDLLWVFDVFSDNLPEKYVSLAIVSGQSAEAYICYSEADQSDGTPLSKLNETTQLDVC